MNKIERVDRVLSGQAPDRPPVSFWYHFGVQHGSGEQFARLSLEFFDYYGLDFLKVMNDYFYPLPDGLETVRYRADLERLTPLDVESTPWREQFKAIKIIAQALSGQAYFIDTVFDPWQTLRRHMAGETIEHLMTQEPEALLKALDVITDNLIAYCHKTLELGAAGIFLSIAAGAELISRTAFLRFVKPYCVRMLAAVQGLSPMNTAHIHGEKLFMEEVLDLPVGILNWWDRGRNGPSLAQVKAKFKGCVMGGIDHTLVARRSPGFLKKHTFEAKQLGGATRYLMSGGCSIDAWAYPGNLKAVVAVAKASN